MKKLIIFFTISLLATLLIRLIPNVESFWYIYFSISSLTYLLGIILIFRLAYLLFKKLDLIESN